MPLALHPSLKKLPLNCRLWLENAESKNELESLFQDLNDYLKISGKLNGKTHNGIRSLGHYYSIAACDAFADNNKVRLSELLPWSISLSALLLRWNGMSSELHQDLGNWPQEFRDSMIATGPLILSRWDEAEICAIRFIQMAEKDQRINTHPESRRVSKGTSDAFLIYLFTQAFHIETTFKPLKPLITEYRALLDNWRTTDESMFKQVMQAAADFHISRSKESTNLKTYEFHWSFSRLFPHELLAIQALRRRDGLPAFETDHLLIDTPWSVIKNLADVEPNPLITALETRFINDYPTFR
jgi:hypothetical protein